MTPDAFTTLIERIKDDDLDGACEMFAQFTAGGTAGACLLAQYLGAYIGSSLGTHHQGEWWQIEIPPVLGAVDPEDVASATFAIVAGATNDDLAGACEVFHTLEADVAIEVISLLSFLTATLIRRGEGA